MPRCQLFRYLLSSRINSARIIPVAEIFVADKIQRPSTPPPIICINDRVLLHYAILNDSVGFTNVTV